MIKSLVRAYHELSKRDLRVLRVIEVGHRRYEFVPEELITKWARYRREEVLDSIRRLHYYGFLRRNLAPYKGWKITALGYDVLALHTLRVQRKVVKISPTPIGIGKESVVYAGETPSGYKVAIKFHRGGVSAFRYEEPFRSKVARYKHLAEVFETRLSALAEFFALQRVFEGGGLVPEPLTYNRHVVVMGYVEGVELYRLSQGDFKKIADDVILTLGVALRLGIVHGDLSPYNIIVGNRSYVIDWPQWVPLGYNNYELHLQRDLNNIAKFFKRYQVEIPVDELLKTAREAEDSGGKFLLEINKTTFL
ncbi:serine/threonine-protein kinase RIO2 [Pyrobaculum aerophilum]|uniref:non-specific serine/threonine protein kinase n=2 Tax=Pyrobaculum aerophilum TaxID=13773 RepID=Q8ZYP5_PYRAE|nr:MULTISPECIES: serine/threonine-protein kinase RIO2 [Pyrobaculum]AAL62948.1 conserved hypothetical protein [Pyrobaculum aerophilum str. IM2]MCX8137459.1 serine/threonine-protein kinase RIO2 [Pyrobaculum aerophilum]RFA94235.1 serine/threonine protein kinase [Pyrobaculum aerophilum]RFA94904.1 serine/threonine protein kinase [Pyrobaculum aerophilum]HII46084.1 serine/threonine protein kinase [Pyrobaculum aerophilum]